MNFTLPWLKDHLAPSAGLPAVKGAIMRLAFAIGSGSLLASACAGAPVADGSRERAAATVTIDQITADSKAWSGKWVVLEGVLTWGEGQSRIYKDTASAEDGWIYDPAGISIRMSEIRKPVPKSLDMKRVHITAILDDGCVRAHQMAEAMAASGRIAWASGYCHTAIGPDLIEATVHEVR